MSENYAEPWVVQKDEAGRDQTVDAKGEEILSADWDAPGNPLEIQQRIVACVNALRGIQTNKLASIRSAMADMHLLDE